MRTPPLSLRNHQQAELEYLRAHRRSLLLSEVGTGKTPVLLRYALDFIDRGEQVVWLTETGLTRQLLVEARLWLPATAQPVQLHRAGPDTPFIVSSHHLIRSRIQQLEWLIPKAVIVDEAGVLGCGEDPHSPLYEAVSDMIGRADLSVLATATPVRTAHALDLFALMEAGGTPGTPFRSQIQREIRTEQAPTRYGHRSFPVSIRSAGLNLLTAALSQGAVRSTAADLCEPLPTVTSPTIEVPLTPSTLAAYRKAEDQRGLAGHQARQKLSRSLGPLVREVVDYVTTGPGRHHAHPVVFTEYHDLVRPIVSALSSLGWPVWTLTGNMTAAQRHRAITEHRQCERGFLVGTEALETGLNLQYSSLLISVVPTWDPARERQRVGRLRRMGSPFSEIVHVTIRPDVSIERRKDARHAAKEGVARKVLDSVPSPMAITGQRKASAS